jgi:hypothetical protein
MTGKKQTGGRWRETTVVIRDDILARAEEAKLDISRLCNQALADATGIPYSRKPADGAPAAPVIIARNGAPSPEEKQPPAAAQPVGRLPVINADAPGAAVTARQAPRPPAPKPPAALPGRVTPVKTPAPPAALKTPQPERTAPAIPAPALPAPGSGVKKPESAKKPPGKKGRDTTVRRFVGESIVRDDADEALVPKEEMYQAFSRWCREHRVAPVPDRRVLTVALKNQFALQETAAGSEPSWVNVRLK